MCSAPRHCWPPDAVRCTVGRRRRPARSRSPRRPSPHLPSAGAAGPVPGAPPCRGGRAARATSARGRTGPGARVELAVTGGPTAAELSAEPLVGDDIVLVGPPALAGGGCGPRPPGSPGSCAAGSASRRRRRHPPRARAARRAVTELQSGEAVKLGVAEGRHRRDQPTRDRERARGRPVRPRRAALAAARTIFVPRARRTAHPARRAVPRPATRDVRGAEPRRTRTCQPSRPRWSGGDELTKPLDLIQRRPAGDPGRRRRQRQDPARARSRRSAGRRLP